MKEQKLFSALNRIIRAVKVDFQKHFRVTFCIFI